MHNKRRVYLHVGSFKTGSSALQRFCTRQRELLKESGVDYLPGARPTSNPSNHGKLALSLYTRYGQKPPDWYCDRDSYATVAAEIRAAIDASACPSVVISTEELYRVAGFPEEARAGIGRDLQELFAGLDVRVIMYVRTPMTFARSWYNEMNKARPPRSRFVDFVYSLQPSMLLPHDNAEYWRSLFGRDALHIEPYCLKGSQHVQRFLRLLGIADLTVGPNAIMTINPKRDETTLERDRLQKILALSDSEQRTRMLRSRALASVRNFDRLQAKVEDVERRFDEFAAREGIELGGPRFTLAEILVHDERVNRRDVVTVSPWGVFLLRRRDGALAGWIKRARDLLMRTVSQ